MAGRCRREVALHAERSRKPGLGSTRKARGIEVPEDAIQDQIHEARAIAHTLLQAFPEGAEVLGRSAKATLGNALRLAELSAELLPVMEGAIAEGVEATVRRMSN